MLEKKMGSMKKLGKKSKSKGHNFEHEPSYREYLLTDVEEPGSPFATAATPKGFVAVYVGEERQRFVVPTGYLSHPLFKMLLEKSDNEFGFQQNNGLVVPCSITAYEEVVAAMECCNGKFDFGNLVPEFL